MRLTRKELKTIITLFLVLTITFGSVMAYRAATVDPVQDAIYSKVYGLEEK